MDDGDGGVSYSNISMPSIITDVGVTNDHDPCRTSVGMGVTDTCREAERVTR